MPQLHRCGSSAERRLGAESAAGGKPACITGKGRYSRKARKAEAAPQQQALTETGAEIARYHAAEHPTTVAEVPACQCPILDGQRCAIS